MSKHLCICITALVVIFSVLWPYLFTSSTEKELRKELVDKDQRIIGLLNKQVDAEKDISRLKETIRLLNKPGVNSKCLEDLECTFAVKDCEREVQKLEGEIKLLQGHVNANTKEFTTCQQMLDDCHARNHISSEKSSDRYWYIIMFGILSLLCGGWCCCAFIAHVSKQEHERKRHQQEQREIQQQRQQERHEAEVRAILAKQKEPRRAQNPCNQS